MTVDEYKKLFPDVVLHDKEVIDKLSKSASRTNAGRKYSDESRQRMSKTRKNKIANGEILTPFMTENKFGENNPAWGKSRHSEKELNLLKEKLSKIMTIKIKNGEFNYKYGKFHSKKTNKIVLYRSSYELRVLQILENLDCVSHFEYETLSIPYKYKNVFHNYIPDFLVSFIGGIKVLMEVGPSTFKTHRSKPIVEKFKHTAAIEYCKLNNIEFTIVTEDTILALDKLKNRVNCWEYLKSFCHNMIGNDECEGLKNKTMNNGKSAAKLLNNRLSMETAQRLGFDIG